MTDGRELATATDNNENNTLENPMITIPVGNKASRIVVYCVLHP
jgi:hypothetical protein